MTFDSKQCDCVSVCASKHITVESGQFVYLFTRYSETTAFQFCEGVSSEMSV